LNFLWARGRDIRQGSNDDDEGESEGEDGNDSDDQSEENLEENQGRSDRKQQEEQDLVYAKKLIDSVIKQQQHDNRKKFAVLNSLLIQLHQAHLQSTASKQEIRENIVKEFDQWNAGPIALELFSKILFRGGQLTVCSPGEYSGVQSVNSRFIFSNAPQIEFAISAVTGVEYQNCIETVELSVAEKIKYQKLVWKPIVACSYNENNSLNDKTVDQQCLTRVAKLLGFNTDKQECSKLFFLFLTYCAFATAPQYCREAVSCSAKRMREEFLDSRESLWQRIVGLSATSTN